MTVDEFFACNANTGGPLITIERRDGGEWMAVLSLYGNECRELRAVGSTVHEALRKLVVDIEKAKPGAPVGVRMW